MAASQLLSTSLSQRWSLICDGGDSPVEWDSIRIATTRTPWNDMCFFLVAAGIAMANHRFPVPGQVFPPHAPVTRNKRVSYLLYIFCWSEVVKTSSSHRDFVFQYMSRICPDSEFPEVNIWNPENLGIWLNLGPVFTHFPIEYGLFSYMFLCVDINMGASQNGATPKMDGL